MAEKKLPSYFGGAEVQATVPYVPPSAGIAMPMQPAGGIPLEPKTDYYGEAQANLGQVPSYNSRQDLLDRLTKKYQTIDDVERGLDSHLDDMGSDDLDRAHFAQELKGFIGGLSARRQQLGGFNPFLSGQMRRARMANQTQIDTQIAGAMKMLQDVYDNTDSKTLQLTGELGKVVKEAQDEAQNLRATDFKALTLKAREDTLNEQIRNHNLRDQASQRSGDIRQGYLDIAKDLAPDKKANLELQNLLIQQYGPAKAAAVINSLNTNAALAPVNAEANLARSTGGVPTNLNVPQPPRIQTGAIQKSGGKFSISAPQQGFVPPPAPVIPDAASQPPYGVMTNPDGSIVPSPLTQNTLDNSAVNREKAKAGIASTETKTAIDLVKLRKSFDRTKRATGLSDQEILQKKPEYAALFGQGKSNGGSILSADERARLIELRKAQWLREHGQ